MYTNYSQIFKNMQKKKVIVVVGPTASGKSSLAHKIAKEFGGFLISADSRQVYKGMDIGTNKDHFIRKRRGLFGQTYLIDGVEEKMIDLVKPNQEFNLDDWLRETKRLIEKDDRLAIVVGGTSLYISALVEGYELIGGFDNKYRKQLERQLETEGLMSLVKKLSEIDPEADKIIDIENSRRVIRALELYEATGQIINKEKNEPEFAFLVLGKSLPREVLYEKIDKRVLEMIDEGLVDEVKSLIKKGYKKSLSSMTGIGYRQIVGYLDGEYDLNEAIRLIQRDTRRYAKQQLTWYKRDENIKWVDSWRQSKELVEHFLSTQSH